MDQLKVTKKTDEGKTILDIEGSLNSYTYTDFQDKLYALIEKGSVVIDMSKVGNLSSAGLGVLMSAVETGEEKGNKIHILKPSDVVKMAIDSTGFSEMFNIIEDINQAF